MNNNVSSIFAKRNYSSDNKGRMPSQQSDNTSFIITEHFLQIFKPYIAIKQQLKDEVFKIRQSIYREEIAIDKLSNPLQVTDEFDKHSLFTLLKHTPSATFSSCVRLVTSSNESELLPIEKYCIGSITKAELNPECFNRNEIAEISRIAVNPRFRQSKVIPFMGSNIADINEAKHSETELHSFSFICIGLYIAAITMGLHAGIKHMYVMMNPKVARSMNTLGIACQPIGSAMEHHGTRAPYYINPNSAMKNLSPAFRKLFIIINSDLSSQLA